MLLLSMIACGVNKAGNTNENKDSVESAGGVSGDSNNPNEIKENVTIMITSTYSPKTLELKSINMQTYFGKYGIETNNMMDTSVPQLKLNGKSIYLSKEHSKEIRNFAVQIYNSLVGDEQSSINAMYPVICDEFAKSDTSVHIPYELSRNVEAYINDVKLSGDVSDAQIGCWAFTEVKEEELAEYQVAVRKRENSNGTSYMRPLEVRLIINLETANSDELANYLDTVWNEDVDSAFSYYARGETDFIDTFVSVASDSNEQVTSESAAAEDFGVVGRWIPNQAEMYYCIELNMDLTGTLYRADKTYPLTYTYSGGKVTVITDFDGTSIKTLYYYENGKLISDQDNTFYTRE
jgi:hypothetical protein